MFAPWNYNEPDGSWMVDLIWGDPLTRLMSNDVGANAPYATQYVPPSPSPQGLSQGFSADRTTRRTATPEAASTGPAC